MPAHQHAQQPGDDEPPPPDELDVACRRMLAETLRPCRELSRDQRAADRLEALDRNTVLAAWYGRGADATLRAG